MLFSLNSNVIKLLQRLAFLLGFVVLVVVFAGPYLGFTYQDGGVLRVEKSDKKETQKLTVENATFTSRDKLNRPVEIIAEKAIPKNQEMDQVDLGAPKAKLQLKDGRTLDVQSNAGDYDRDANQLKLRGDVRFADNLGYELKTQSGTVSLNTNNFETNSDVIGSGPTGRMSAEGMLVDQANKRLILKGKSELVFDVKQIKADQEKRKQDKINAD